MKEQSGEGEKRGDEQCPLSLSLSLCGAALSRLLRFYLSFYPDERCFFVEKKRLKGPRRREAEGAFFVCEEEGERREKLKKKNQVFLIFFSALHFVFLQLRGSHAEIQVAGRGAFWLDSWILFHSLCP